LTGGCQIIPLAKSKFRCLRECTFALVREMNKFPESEERIGEIPRKGGGG